MAVLPNRNTPDMKEYDYVLIQMSNVPKHKLKDNSYICQTINDLSVYTPSRFTNLHDSSHFGYQYLAILKKETRQNMLEKPKHIKIEETDETILDSIIFTDWSCIWIEPLTSAIYKYFNDLVNSFKLTCKLENIFMNSVSINTDNIKPIDTIWYGFNNFPHHINKTAMDKIKQRQLKNGIGDIWYESNNSKMEIDDNNDKIDTDNDKIVETYW